MTVTMGSRITEADGMRFWYKYEESLFRSSREREYHQPTPVQRSEAVEDRAASHKREARESTALGGAGVLRRA